MSIVPNHDLWWGRMVSLLTRPNFNPALAKISATAGWNVNAHSNHDGIYCAVQGLRARPGDAALTEYLGHQRRLYRDGYVLPNKGRVAGYYCFPEGLALDWEVHEDAASRAALVQLRTSAAYVNSGGSGDEELSREVAYALLTHVEADRLGLARWDTARVAALVDFALAHVAQWRGPPSAWAGGTYAYIQPFMMGITGMALAKYLDHVEGAKATTDARIVPALLALAVRLRQRWWNAAGGRFLQYLYADGRKPSDPAYGDVLNNMIAPVFAWLYRRTGSVYFATAADEAFRYGIDSADIFHPKQYNENYRWTHLLVAWRDAAPLGRDAAQLVLDSPPAAGGPAGAASDAFCVMPLAPFTGTITPGDGGARGKFDPPSLSWSGTAEPMSFTYTPASAGVVAISVASDGGLADPTPVRYVATAAPGRKFRPAWAAHPAGRAATMGTY